MYTVLHLYYVNYYPPLGFIQAGIKIEEKMTGSEVVQRQPPR
jgi:hypothetical protein